MQVGQKAEQAKAALEAEVPAGVRVFLIPQVGCAAPAHLPACHSPGRPQPASQAAARQASLLPGRPARSSAAVYDGHAGSRSMVKHPTACTPPATPTPPPRPPLGPASLPQGSMVTMDFRTDRIRVFYDEQTGLVVTPPRVG